ncbi:hypothetical protein C4K18_4078 [Pseudomonas chlororaphis subsp. aurantiaca]|nr:hypothetical protein C4K18_4078 [Pseudomonas chlororaphis subsp. aurantiaca]
MRQNTIAPHFYDLSRLSACILQAAQKITYAPLNQPPEKLPLQDRA